MPRLIKAYLRIYYSKRDKAGNCYFAFEWDDIDSGKSVNGTISGGESNIVVAIRHMDMGDVNNVSYSLHETPIRQWNRLTRDWPYAGCTPVEIAAHIKKGLDKATT